MGKRAIPLFDNLALRPWHLRVNLDTEAHYASVIHLRHREGKETLGDVIKSILLIA